MAALTSYLSDSSRQPDTARVHTVGLDNLNARQVYALGSNNCIVIILAF